jgi:hypothetical protein
MLDFTLENISTEEVDRLRAVYGPLAESVREFRYVRATRLGRLHAEATTTHTEGVKTYAVGHLADDEGITVEAEGVFIQPRWARDGSE